MLSGDCYAARIIRYAAPIANIKAIASISNPVLVYKGEDLASYGFGDPHPFGYDRHDAFQEELENAGLDGGVEYAAPRCPSVDDLLLFHTPDYIDMVSS